MPQPLGVIHVLITGQPSEHGLPQHSHQSVPTILSRSRVGENIVRHRGEAEGVIEFPISKQPGVRSHHRSTKLKQQAAVEIDPERAIVCFTRRVRHQGALHVRRSPCKI